MWPQEQFRQLQNVPLMAALDSGKLKPYLILENPPGEVSSLCNCIFGGVSFMSQGVMYRSAQPIAHDVSFFII
jgi:hypothetical protein